MQQQHDLALPTTCVHLLLLPQGQELPPWLAVLYEESSYGLVSLADVDPPQEQEQGQQEEEEGGQGGGGGTLVPDVEVPPLEPADVRQLLLEPLEALVASLEEGEGVGSGAARGRGARSQAGAGAKAVGGRRKG